MVEGLLGLCAFLVGSFPTGLMVARAHGVDLRRVGSGNIGATNVGRVLGKPWAATVLLIDALKGFGPAYLAGRLSLAPPAVVAIALAAVLGHTFSVFLKGRGGKGVATASIARILKSRGFRVSAVKIDPYINVDAGTMNPTEHGEVFVTEDGMECDQDVGNYERFLDENIPKENYMTTGMVYLSVIERERNLAYGGRQVEVVPHIPEEVIHRLDRASRKAKADFMIVEIGGTVGEYQNILFLEAARMMRLARPGDVLFVLVSYLPVPKMLGEMKTKPTQYAVRSMNAAGIQPDIIIARSEVPMDEPRKKKLVLMCNLSERDIISAPDVNAIYEVPINFEKDRLGDRSGQRNLSQDGIRQARRLGDALHALRVPLNEILASPVFRARDTAELAFGADRTRVTMELVADEYAGNQLRAMIEGTQRLLRTLPGPGMNRILVEQRSPLEMAASGARRDRSRDRPRRSCRGRRASPARTPWSTSGSAARARRRSPSSDRLARGRRPRRSDGCS
jgi:hypothetical protein